MIAWNLEAEPSVVNAIWLLLKSDSDQMWDVGHGNVIIHAVAHAEWKLEPGLKPYSLIDSAINRRIKWRYHIELDNLPNPARRGLIITMYTAAFQQHLSKGTTISTFSLRKQTAPSVWAAPSFVNAHCLCFKLK